MKRVDTTPYYSGARGTEARPSVLDSNQRTVPVRSCKRRFHGGGNNVVELFVVGVGLSERDHSAMFACVFASV